MSLATALVAQGTAQGTALVLRRRFNSFATVGSGLSAVLPADVPVGFDIMIRNNGANALTVFPPVGGAFNGGTVNASTSIGTSATSRFVHNGGGNYWLVDTKG